jgi:hypothetical protein
MSFFLIVGTSLKEILLKIMCILHIKNRNICLQEGNLIGYDQS